MRKLLFLFCFFTSTFALQNDPYELAAFGGEPSSVIGGCVSAISGDYFFIEDALIVKGYEPIRLQQRYISRDAKRGYSGWNLWENHLVAALHVSKSPMGNNYLLQISERSGVRLIYTDNLLAKKDRNHFILISTPGGLTNCSKGEISARLNLRNNVVYRDTKDPKQIIVKGADGSKRCYRCKESLKFDKPVKGLNVEQVTVRFYLSWEHLPNGNQIKYDYKQIHGKWFPEKITTSSQNGKETFAWVRFDYNYPDKEHLFSIKITTSDDQNLDYTFDPHAKNRKKRHWLLKGVTHPIKPDESYEYSPGGKGGFYLSDKKHPDGRRLKINYYGRDKTVLPLGEVNIKDENDQKYKRVSSLLAPIGNNQNIYHAFQIFYHPGKYQERGGHTNAYDALGNLIQYRYDKNLMLTSQKRFTGKEELFSEDLFHWHPKGTKKANWIQGKTLLDEKGNPLFAYLYHYDDKGNVIQEDLWGDITGNRKKLIRNGDQFPHTNQAECYSIKRNFNGDNLLSQEIMPNGLKVEYHYYPGTDRLHSKYHYDHNKIQKREYFIYDGSILIKEIVDDGHVKDVNNLTGATQRIIKKITPRKGQSFCGFPEIIEEMYWDFETGRETLLRKQVIEYNKRGFVSKMSHYDANNTFCFTLSYEYDHKGRLIAQTDPLGRKLTVAFDSNDNPILENDPNEAFSLYQTYDYSNRLTQEEKRAPSNEKRALQIKYNLLSQKTVETNDQGNQTFFEHNPFGHLEKVTLPKMTFEEGQKSPTIQRKYNALGKVTLEIDPEGNRTQTFYTSLGKPYRIVHPDGAEENFLYDLSGNLKTHITPTGAESHFTYDYQNRITSKKVIKGKILSEETYSYNAFHLLEKTDPDGITTYYSYDGAGRKIKEVTEKRQTLFTYDALGRLEKVIKDSQVVQKKYDLLNRVTHEFELDHEGTLFGWVHYSYDDYSNQCAVKKEVHVGETVYQTEYDPFRRVVKETNPLGQKTVITYNDYFKDRHGQTVTQKTTRDPKGREIKETYNPQGNLVELERFGLDGHLLVRENFFYDLNGKKIKQKSELFDPDKTIVKTWKYDVRGRVIELNESGEKITTYGYTPDSQLKTLTKPDGIIITYEYDGLGRQIELKTSDGSCHYTFKHDKMGYVIESKDELSGLITQRTYNHFGEVLHETLANGLSLDHTYDPLGRPKELIFSDQSRVIYGYDPYHLRSVKRLNSYGVEYYEHIYDEYDKSHNLISEFYPGSIGPAYHQIDLLGRRIRTDSIYSSEIIEEIDSTGNVTQYLRDYNDEQEVMEYTYDDLDQLTLETGPFSHQYAYDAHYNRLQKDEEQCEVDSLHQLLAQGEVSHTYDPNGNRTTTTKGPHEIAYTYDGLDRLTHVRSGSQAVRYSYDSWGRCLTRTYYTLQEGEWKLTQTNHFLFDGQNELGTYPHELRILGQGKGAEIGAAVVIERGNDFFVPIHDLFGNAIAAMDWDGTCLESYRHSAYGEEKIFNGDVIMVRSGTNPWRYQSKRKMGGLINFGRRFYDPETGRWLSPDPKGFDEGPNLYQYLRNSPLLYFDLYGLSVESGESYSPKQFLKDVGYVYYYTARRTYEGYATANPKMAFALANFGQALGNVISGNYERPVPTRSEHIVLSGKKHPKLDTYFFNGMLNNRNDAIESAKFLQSNLNGYEVNLIFNNTHGILDLLDFAAAKIGIPTGTSKLAYNVINKQTISQDRLALIFAHSEGTGVSKNTLSHFTSEQRQNMDYIGIGSAQIHPKGYSGSSINSMSGNDLISFFGNPVNCIGSAVFKDDHVQFLKPDSNTPWGDHGFLSPVNREFLERECKYRTERYNMN